MYQYTRTGYMFVDCDDSPDPPERCGGPGYDNAHGCGRFLSAGKWMCARCSGETDEYWRDYDAHEKAQRAAEAQAIKDETAYWTAFKNSPEGKAQRAAEDAALAEFDDFGHYAGPVEFISEDLSF